ncbi:uncharacterized protein TNCV_3664741 [Trichonephila clavipes]|nr:uncharacterized protein TNCV_3664741 [Trichonephila clavipes]
MKGDSVSTKLRVVFDGTCKLSNGNSLNSILAIGKMLQPDLFTILVKFRLNEIAFSADIQQMYKQKILIDQEDQNFQLIVWRESKQPGLLGKEIETHPGKDGAVRVATLRTVKDRFKRPIHKLELPTSRITS